MEQKNHVFKRAIACLMVVLMLLTSAPLAGFDGLVTMKASAAVNLTSAQIKSYVESRVGQGYASNSCLAFVRECFMALGGPASTACCAYKYGNSYIKSNSKDNIPIGADVFFGNRNIKCGSCGNYCGHIGIYVGNGEMVHASGGKVLKSKLTYVSNYRGWGYHGGINIVDGGSGGGSMNTPTISFGKSSYNVGEQVTFSWTASSNAALSHYWVIVDLPGGIPWISTRIDKSVTSYSFTAEKEGSYYVYVAATPYGSQSGEGSLECEKYIDVTKSQSLATPNIVFKKSHYSVDEQVTFSWTASPNAILSHYWVIVDLPGGIPWISTMIDKSVTSYSFTAEKEGSYYVYVAATPYNSQFGEGSLECKKYIEVKPLVENHNYTSKITAPATCTTDGVRTYTCTTCGKSYTETIAKTGHKYDSGKVSKTPTCSAEGVKTYTCTVCGAKKKETIAKDPNNHSDAGGLDSWNYIEPSCTKNGYSGDWYCSDCDGLVQKGKVIKKTGHKDKNQDDYCDNCGKYLRKDPVEIKGAKVTAQTSKTITGTWKKTGGSGTVYRLFLRKNGDKYFEHVGSTKNNKYTFKKLKPGTSYEWFVVVWNSDGSDKAISDDVKAATLPSAPSIKVTAGKKKADVKWGKVTGATNYTVYYSTSKNSGYKKAGTTSGKSYTVKKLKPGKTYYFKVVANKKVGGKTYTSAYSKIVSAKIKK